MPSTVYESLKARLCQNYRHAASRDTRDDAIRNSPLVSLAVKCAVEDDDADKSGGKKTATESEKHDQHDLAPPQKPSFTSSATVSSLFSSASPFRSKSQPQKSSGSLLFTGTPPSSSSIFNFDGKSQFSFASSSVPVISSGAQPGSTFGSTPNTFLFQRPGPSPSSKQDTIIPQYGVLGYDLENRDSDNKPEPILLNTNAPSSVFLCGQQGSGKSYTLSCMLESHLLNDESVGRQHETIPGFVFHWDTNTSGNVAEAASLCSRGIKVRALVSWSNYQQMKALYEKSAREAGGEIEVRPLLFDDKELTVNNIRNLMAFNDPSKGVPLYLEVLQGILRKYGRNNQAFSVQQFLQDMSRAGLLDKQTEVLGQRITLLKNFSAATAPGIVEEDHRGLTNRQLMIKKAEQGLNFQGPCIRVEKGTLTIIDLSDPFVDANTACTLFDIVHGIILKCHKEALDTGRISAAGLVLSLDEAHKFLDKDLPSAESFTSSLLTTIREQRHNAARVIIATQEPSISEKLLDLCSVSIVHGFNTPDWFDAIAGHLGGASSLAAEPGEGRDCKTARKDALFRRILALQTGESLVFSPRSWVRGGGGKETIDVNGDTTVTVEEPRRLGSEVLWMMTRERKGKDAGRTLNVVGH